MTDGGRDDGGEGALSVEVQGRYGGLLRSAVVAVDPLDVSGGGGHVGSLPRSVDHGFEEVDGAGDPVVDDGAGAAEEALQAAVEEVDACPPVGVEGELFHVLDCGDGVGGGQPSRRSHDDRNHGPAAVGKKRRPPVCAGGR